MPGLSCTRPDTLAGPPHPVGITGHAPEPANGPHAQVPGLLYGGETWLRDMQLTGGRPGRAQLTRRAARPGRYRAHRPGAGGACDVQEAEWDPGGAVRAGPGVMKRDFQHTGADQGLPSAPRSRAGPRNAGSPAPAVTFPRLIPVLRLIEGTGIPPINRKARINRDFGRGETGVTHQGRTPAPDAGLPADAHRHRTPACRRTHTGTVATTPLNPPVLKVRSGICR